jgi:hypothetical protein
MCGKEAFPVAPRGELLLQAIMLHPKAVFDISLDDVKEDGRKRPVQWRLTSYEILRPST